jgi:antitoxin (DNA-binding transcriptional repressor) of toxin-antitoxin stability system
MKSINMHEAKTNLSRVVEELLRTGEVYVICRNGEPVAELRAFAPRRDPLVADPSLAVVFHEDPVRPLDPDDWPEALG